MFRGDSKNRQAFTNEDGELGVAKLSWRKGRKKFATRLDKHFLSCTYKVSDNNNTNPWASQKEEGGEHYSLT